MATYVVYVVTVCLVFVQTSQQQSVGCNLGDVSTPCDSSATRYYHDPIDCTCKPLPLGQCQENSYASKMECIENCGMTKCPICNLPVNYGNCTGNALHYYYNIKTCQCELFIFRGCDGNENRFDTLEQCNHVCARFACPVCNLPYDEGNCKGVLDRWYFDDVTCKCKPFRYTGCDGNNNRFYTKQDCQRSCVKSTCNRLRVSCTQPVVVGPCKTTKYRYYYDKEGDTCVRFKWGGCVPTGNNFISKQYCKKKCIKKQVQVNPPPYRGTEDELS